MKISYKKTPDNTESTEFSHKRRSAITEKKEDLKLGIDYWFKNKSKNKKIIFEILCSHNIRIILMIIMKYKNAGNNAIIISNNFIFYFW